MNCFMKSPSIIDCFPDIFLSKIQSRIHLIPILFLSEFRLAMAPTPLLSKGSTSSLARRWRKLKKRCSSFSSGDTLSGGGLVRSKSVTSNDLEDDDAAAAASSKVNHIRQRIDAWNANRSALHSQYPSISALE